MKYHDYHICGSKMFNDYSNVSKCAEIWALCLKKKKNL